MDTNVIYCGDCLEVMRKIPDDSINLIYLDPPFFSKKEYENFWIRLLFKILNNKKHLNTFAFSILNK